MNTSVAMGSTQPRGHLAMVAGGSLQPLPVPLASPSPLPRLPAGNLSKWPTEDEQCSSRGCYPQLFIIGAQKAVMTSLFSALKS